MKKMLLVATVLLLASFVYAQQDNHLSYHDVAVNYAGATTQQGCRGCHIPHGGSLAADLETVNPGRVTVFGTGTSDYTTGANKLWDKNIVNNAYTTYSSDNVAAQSLGEPGSSTAVAWHSYLCFSCHDGSVASLNFASNIMSDPATVLVGTGGTGNTDLTSDHPVDIAWPVAGNTTVATGDYDTAANVTAGTTATLNQALPLYGTTFNVECSTCHNPHMQATPLATGQHGNFLRVGTLKNGVLPQIVDNTTLCRTCHLSKR
jgi:hypothetical protein